jgi:hypothetical protein
MMTTTSEFSSQAPSDPVAAPAKEAPMTPPTPARKAPTKKVTAKTTVTLMPSARTIGSSSTPARMTIPIRVLVSHSHSATPTTTATASMNSRLVAYRCPKISTKCDTAPGHTIVFARPPN